MAGRLWQPNFQLADDATASGTCVWIGAFRCFRMFCLLGKMYPASAAPIISSNASPGRRIKDREGSRGIGAVQLIVRGVPDDSTRTSSDNRFVMEKLA
jgi:hypothetical protein